MVYKRLLKSNGKIEQWGYATTAGTQDCIINYPISFTQSNYPINITIDGTGATDSVLHYSLFNKDKTKCTVRRWYNTGYSLSGLPVMWEAKGD